MAHNHGELIVASNRLPVVMCMRDGGYVAKPASGGLVTALEPVLEQRGGAWIGWPGVADVSASTLRGALSRNVTGHEVIPVELSREEHDAFYLGFSNEIVWPLFHDLQTNCNFDPAYWEVYERVNRKFASAIAQRARPDDLVWVHDYHLMRVGAELRKLGVESRLGFFSHIPFPGRDIFRKLPWREPIADGLLAYDLVGLQTRRDAGNFVKSMKSVRSIERGEARSDGMRAYHTPGSRRVSRVGVFPIGVDFARDEAEARSEEARAAERELREEIGARHIVLGVDRLDYTKGIPQRLVAFEEALRRYPELRGRTTLVQVVVPSRENIAEYSALREEIERLVGSINGELSEPGWIPIIYMHHTVERPKLRGWYRAADVALVTPLKDGMNLVAKEYCASRCDERGVLILSEFAGAAEQLREGALMVNPHDRVAVAEAIARACKMTREEQHARMAPMRRAVQATDVYWWADAFLDELATGVAMPRRLSGRPASS